MKHSKTFILLFGLVVQVGDLIASRDADKNCCEQVTGWIKGCAVVCKPFFGLTVKDQYTHKKNDDADTRTYLIGEDSDGKWESLPHDYDYAQDVVARQTPSPKNEKYHGLSKQTARLLNINNCSNSKLKNLVGYVSEDKEDSYQDDEEAFYQADLKQAKALSLMESENTAIHKNYDSSLDHLKSPTLKPAFAVSMKKDLQDA
jgi:hypothetical protein